MVYSCSVTPDLQRPMCVAMSRRSTYKSTCDFQLYAGFPRPPRAGVCRGSHCGDSIMTIRSTASCTMTGGMRPSPPSPRWLVAEPTGSLRPPLRLHQTGVRHPVPRTIRSPIAPAWHHEHEAARNHAKALTLSRASSSLLNNIQRRYQVSRARRARYRDGALQATLGLETRVHPRY